MPLTRRSIVPLLTLIVLLSLLGYGTAAAATEAKPESSGKTADADLMNRVLPEVSFQDVGFDDVVDFLRDVSGFQAVIVRDPGVPEGQPVIRMRLKSVPLGQVLEVIAKAHPEIGFEPVEHPGGPIVQVIRIRATEETDSTAKQGPKVVRVYPLSGEILAVLRTRGELGPMGGPEKEAAKKGLDDVLSLIKATVEAAGDRAAPTLAVHEETQSLIVTGTREQHATVQDTLAALRGERPHEEQQTALTKAIEHWRQEKTDYAEQIESLQRGTERLKRDLDESRVEAQKAEADARKEAIDAERVRVKLEELLTRGKGSEQPATTTERPRPSADGGSTSPGAK